MGRKIAAKKSIVGIDLDGVILNHAEHKIQLAKQFGIRLSPRDTPADIMRYKINPVMYGTIKKMLYDDPALCAAVTLMRGAKSGLEFLRSKRIPYFLISRRSGQSELPIISLKKNGLWGKYFGYKNAFFVREKKDKDILAAKLSINVFLDDEPGVLDILSSVHDKFLFDPLKAYVGLKDDYRVVRSWREFISQIA